MADESSETPPTSGEYGVNERADSPEARTEDLFSQNGDSPPSISGKRRLGLDIIRPWGWSGSSYSDYEYDGDLMVRRECQAYTIYSVVAVHGIRDDYETAWTEEDGTWWLTNKLFEGLSIREVDYSYEIDEDAAIFQVDGIKMHAEKLLTAYSQDRAGLEDVGPQTQSIQ